MTRMPRLPYVGGRPSSRRTRPRGNPCAARVLQSPKAAPSDESLTNLLAVAAECPPPVPGRRAHDYERDASRAACDILARLGAQRGCREVLEGCVKASGGAVSEEALSQTTLRALLEAAPFLGGALRRGPRPPRRY